MFDLAGIPCPTSRSASVPPRAPFRARRRDTGAGAPAGASAPGARPGAIGSGRVPRRLPRAGGPFGLPIQRAERPSPHIFRMGGSEFTRVSGTEVGGVSMERQGMTLQGQWWSESDSYVSDILSVCSLDSDRPVLRWRGQVISGAELNRSVLEIFHTLRDNGVRKGDVVAVLVSGHGRRRPEMFGTGSSMNGNSPNVARTVTRWFQQGRPSRSKPPGHLTAPVPTIVSRLSGRE